MNELTKFPFQTKINVQWGDMDAAQHLNNVTYLRYAETARISLTEKMGLIWSFEQGEGMILAWQDCKYIFPVTYPDTLLIGCHISEIRSDRFFIQCHMFSQQHQRLVAITNHSHVPYSYKTLQKIPLPAEWIERLKPYRINENS